MDAHLRSKSLAPLSPAPKRICGCSAGAVPVEVPKSQITPAALSAAFSAVLAVQCVVRDGHAAFFAQQWKNLLRARCRLTGAPKRGIIASVGLSNNPVRVIRSLYRSGVPALGRFILVYFVNNKFPEIS